MSEAIVSYRSLDFLGFPDYRVGDDGSVWSRRNAHHKRRANGKCCAFDGEWRRISPGKHPKKGHLLFQLWNDQGVKAFWGHRLVLLAFVGPCPPGMEGCHFPDRNPENNRLENLRWDTKEANEADRIAHGTDNRGSKHGMSKLTEELVREMRRLYDSGACVQKALCDRFGVNASTVNSVVRRHTWKHVT